MIGKLQSLAKIVATVHSEINEFKIKIIINSRAARPTFKTMEESQWTQIRHCGYHIYNIV